MAHVTVTIPAYNHERFIARAIESVLAQTHRELDVVVVDDGSRDGTLEVARRFEVDPRVRCVRNPENLGLARNWNRCLALATGELVMVFGSDDELDADYLERVVARFAEHPDAGFAYAPVRTVDAGGAVVDAGAPRPACVHAAGDAAVSALIRTGVGTVTTVFRTVACRALGGYDEAIADGPDIELCARIAQAYDVIDMGDIGGSFRVHDRKWGHLSYLEPHRLESYMHGNRLVHEKLSAAALRDLGIQDLDRFVARDGARFAIDGALTALAYRRPEVARSYLASARRLDPGSWRRRHFWQAALLLLVPSLGGAVMRRRMEIAG